MNILPINDDTPMPWGKHQGTPMRDVPPEHLLWLLQQNWLPDWPGLWRYLQGRRKELEALKPKETEDVSTSYDDYLRDTYGG
jgi:hypothetical protein